MRCSCAVLSGIARLLGVVGFVTGVSESHDVGERDLSSGLFEGTVEAGVQRLAAAVTERVAGTMASCGGRSERECEGGSF